MDESLLREVVVTRNDDRSYGLTVSGESPVVVQDVKDGGPACLAGVQVGDCIMKVNGTPVSKFNHKEVVQIIKSSHSVRLTVCAGASLPAADTSPESSSSLSSASVLLRHHNKEKQHKITAPLPVNNQLQNQLDVNRHKMLSKMLDTQLKTRENILLELEKKPPKNLAKSLEKELETINSLVETIQTKLRATETENPLSQLHSSSSSSSRRSPAVSHSSRTPPHPTSFHPYLPPHHSHGQLPQHHQGKVHHLSQFQLQFLQDQNMPPPPLPPPQSRSHHNLSHQDQFHNQGLHKKFTNKNSKQKHSRSASEIPPPLPARNRTLLSQISAPNMATGSVASNLIPGSIASITT
ncbi:rho guanine nucleotide exchange factor 12, partial [Hyalella azteca]|uniref:Rho guanine nucleotide exchange factor 12 n=1 Tax=Hyalella azteca TaxID=294128 RepID=A0A8B7NVU9_HYAAZ